MKQSVIFFLGLVFLAGFFVNDSRASLAWRTIENRVNEAENIIAGTITKTDYKPGVPGLKNYNIATIKISETFKGNLKGTTTFLFGKLPDSGKFVSPSDVQFKKREKAIVLLKAKKFKDTFYQYAL